MLVSDQLDRQFHSRANQAGALQQRRGRGGGSQGAHKKQKRLNGVSKCFFFSTPSGYMWVQLGGECWNKARELQ